MRALTLLGLGQIGSGVARACSGQGARWTVERALVRDPHKPRAVVLPPDRLTTSADEALAGTGPVVEVLGGELPAANLIAAALDRGEVDAEALARWSRRLAQRLDLFEGLLTGREYLFGEFGAADCAAYPFLRYAVELDEDDPWTFHRVLHERMPLAPHHAGLRGWLARMAERPQR